MPVLRRRGRGGALTRPLMDPPPPQTHTPSSPIFSSSIHPPPRDARGYPVLCVSIRLSDLTESFPALPAPPLGPFQEDPRPSLTHPLSSTIRGPAASSRLFAIGGSQKRPSSVRSFSALCAGAASAFWWPHGSDGRASSSIFFDAPRLAGRCSWNISTPGHLSSLLPAPLPFFKCRNLS